MSVPVATTTAPSHRELTGEAPLPEGPPAASPAARTSIPWAPLALHLASLAAAFAVLLHLGRNLWFFLDEWDFIATRRHGSDVGVWVPHNEHWSTIPVLVFRGLYDGFGLHSYRPYLAVLLVFHVVLAHLLWRWIVRIGGDPWLAAALVAMFLVLGAGYEDLLSAFQLSFVGSVMFGVTALLLIDHRGRFGARDLGAWLAAVAALMCSGVGVSMVAVMGIAVLLRRGWRAAALAVSVPAAAYVAWFLTHGRANANTIPASRAQLLMVPTYVWTGITRSLEGITGLTGAGAVLALGMLALLLRERRLARHRAATAYAAALGTVVFFTVGGVGRIALGIDQAASSRYVYIACALLLAAAAVLLTELARGSAAITGVVIVAVGAATLQGAGALVSGARQQVAALTPSRAQVLAAARLVQTGAPILAGPDALPEPQHDPNLTLEGLRQLVAEGAFGTIPEQPAEGRLAAAVQLQVVVGDTAAIQGPAPRLSSTPAGSRGGTGCANLHEAGPVTLRLLFTGPASITVTPQRSGRLSVAMATTADPDLLSAQRSFPLVAGLATVVSVAATGAAPVLSLPAGDDLVCGLQL